jgi:hypothetical protein
MAEGAAAQYQLLPVPRDAGFDPAEIGRINNLSGAISAAFQKTNVILNHFNTYVRNVNFKNNIILTIVNQVRLKVYNLLRLINKLNRRIQELEGQGQEGEMMGQEDNQNVELQRLIQQKAYLMTLLDRATGTLMQLRDGIDNIMQNPDLDLTADKTSQFVGVINQINALLQDILSKQTPPNNVVAVGDNEIPLTQEGLAGLDAAVPPAEADVDNAPPLPPNSINIIPPALGGKRRRSVASRSFPIIFRRRSRRNTPAPPPGLGGGKRRRRKTRKLRRKSRGGKKSKSKSRKGIRGRSKRGGFKAVYPQLSHKKMSKSRTSKSSKSSRSSNRSSRTSRNSTDATSK